MERVIVIRRVLIVSIGLSCLLSACEDDCEQETISDERQFNVYTMTFPPSIPAIRCYVVTICPDPNAVDGKAMRSNPRQFKMPDLFHDQLNTEACEKRAKQIVTFIGCTYETTFDRLCAAPDGGGDPSP